MITMTEREKKIVGTMIALNRIEMRMEKMETKTKKILKLRERILEMKMTTKEIAMAMTKYQIMREIMITMN